MHEAAFGLHTSEALTEAGKWETIFFQFFSVFFGGGGVCSQLRPVAARNIHRLC